MNKNDLIAFRQRHELSQEALARLLAVSVRTIARWEMGSTRIPNYLALALDGLAQKLRAAA
jgi:DNA-binding transcriptional regulator YiaG